MIADMCAMGTVLAAVPPLRLGETFPAAEDAQRPPGTLVVQGPGGTGKTLLLKELASAYRRAGLAVVDADSAPDPSEVTGELAVLVDDAHHLTDETAGRVHRLLHRPGTRTVVAFRPWPRPPALAGLVEALGSDRRSVVLSHVDRGLVQSWAREHLGSAALTADPVLAGELLGAAADSGAPVAGLAARRAQAAALVGDFDAALQLADAVLTDDDAPDRSRAACVTAAVLAHRGLQAQSAELYRLAGPERGGSSALSLIAVGSPAEALTVLDGAETATSRRCPSTLSGSEALMARGILQSLHTGPDAAEDISAALSTLSRAATLLEPVGRTALLPDTPAALAALVALHSGELGVAESVLERTLAADVGGPPSRPRHHLLLGWVAMLRGRMARARTCVERAQAAARHGLEPRDELFHRALAVGLARRAGDTPALVAAWALAREALLRYPIDLFTLLPLGELIVAGARLDEGARLAPHMSEAQALLGRLGHPQLWATPLHWSGAQAAILNDDPAALRPHAAALVAAARTSPYAATLARAGRCWLRVLTGDIDASAVETAARDLVSVGLAWDGSRLAGQAAVRTGDPRARTSLLSCARALAEGCGIDVAPAAPAPTGATSPPVSSAAGLLSEREREVARLVVSGQTYREIGGRLFISAKTVEHHVSRMRQRLGASNRSDLLARLRVEIAEGA